MAYFFLFKINLIYGKIFSIFMQSILMKKITVPSHISQVDVLLTNRLIAQAAGWKRYEIGGIISYEDPSLPDALIEESELNFHLSFDTLLPAIKDICDRVKTRDRRALLKDITGNGITFSLTQWSEKGIDYDSKERIITTAIHSGKWLDNIYLGTAALMMSLEWEREKASSLILTPILNYETIQE